MSEKNVRLAVKFAAALALIALPAFGIAALATHESAPATSVASTTTTTSTDTTGWD